MAYNSGKHFQNNLITSLCLIKRPHRHRKRYLVCNFNVSFTEQIIQLVQVLQSSGHSDLC